MNSRVTFNNNLSTSLISGEVNTGQVNTTDEQKVVKNLAKNIFDTQTSRLSSVEGTLRHRTISLSKSVRSTVVSATEQIRQTNVGKAVDKVTKNKKINIIGFSMGFLLSGSSDLGKVISGGIYLLRKKQQLKQENISEIKKNIIETRIKKAQRETGIAFIKFLFSATGSYISRAIAMAKYVAVEHREWALATAQSVTYQTLGTVASFGAAVLDGVFLYRNKQRDLKLKKCHDTVVDQIDQHIKTNSGTVNIESLQNDKKLNEALKTIAMSKQGSQTVYKNAINILDSIEKGNVDLKQLQDVKNLNDARSRYEVLGSCYSTYLTRGFNRTHDFRWSSLCSNTTRCFCRFDFGFIAWSNGL